eukprot:GHUV01028470.1.p1 GENE.GHUV01028470.1~~GHUV01028470.1.p1  ORF type:complete len:145 (+),score=42.59 GHUV01028470.1:184-618(+)
MDPRMTFDTHLHAQTAVGDTYLGVISVHSILMLHCCPAYRCCVSWQINAEKSPYLTDKLKIWMLPTLALIKSEKVLDYVVGFDDLGGRDDFSTEALADRLAAVDVIKQDEVAAAAARQRQQQRHTIRSGLYQKDADDEDSDFDE